MQHKDQQTVRPRQQVQTRWPQEPEPGQRLAPIDCLLNNYRHEVVSNVLNSYDFLII